MGCAILQGNKIMETWTKDFFDTKKWKKTIKREDKYALYTEWARTTGYYLMENNVSIIIIEGQMKRDLVALSYYLYGLWTGMGYFDSVEIVHPSLVKKKFGTGTGNYKNNKEMACLFTGLKDHNQADAVMLALYCNVGSSTK